LFPIFRQLLQRLPNQLLPSLFVVLVECLLQMLDSKVNEVFLLGKNTLANAVSNLGSDLLVLALTMLSIAGTA